MDEAAPRKPPVTFAAWLEIVLLRELDAFERELDLFGDEALIWRVVPGVSNPAGTLALHVSGNLQHYLGAVLGGSGYVRDREREFSRRGVSRQEIALELHRTKQVVREVFAGLPPERLAADYPEEVAGARVPTGLFLVHLSTHLAHHLGQVGILRRTLTGENRSSGAVSIRALVPAGRRSEPGPSAGG